MIWALQAQTCMRRNRRQNKRYQKNKKIKSFTYYIFFERNVAYAWNLSYLHDSWLWNLIFVIKFESTFWFNLETIIFDLFFLRDYPWRNLMPLLAVIAWCFFRLHGLNTHAHSLSTKTQSMSWLLNTTLICIQAMLIKIFKTIRCKMAMIFQMSCLLIWCAFWIMPWKICF